VTIGESELVHLNITAQGQVLQCSQRTDALTLTRPRGGGQRGTVTHFSDQSRFRLIKTFAKFDRREAARQRGVLFVTLTYQDNMTDHARAARDLRAWRERLRRAYPAAWVVWRKELQERGAIHFHLMLGNVGYLHVTDQEGAWNAQRAWNEVVGQDANNSLDVERMRSFNGVMWYVSKYMAKDDDDAATDATADDATATPANHQYSMSNRVLLADDDMVVSARQRLGLSISHKLTQSTPGTGRWWGVFGRKYLPLAEIDTETVTLPRQLYNWWLSKVDSTYCAARRGWTVFTDSAYALLHAAYTTMINHAPHVLGTYQGLRTWWRELHISQPAKNGYDAGKAKRESLDRDWEDMQLRRLQQGQQPIATP